MSASSTCNNDKPFKETDASPATPRLIKELRSRSDNSRVLGSPLEILIE